MTDKKSIVSVEQVPNSFFEPDVILLLRYR